MSAKEKKTILIRCNIIQTQLHERAIDIIQKPADRASKKKDLYVPESKKVCLQVLKILRLTTKLGQSKTDDSVLGTCVI